VSQVVGEVNCDGSKTVTRDGSKDIQIFEVSTFTRRIGGADLRDSCITLTFPRMSRRPPAIRILANAEQRSTWVDLLLAFLSLNK